MSCILCIVFFLLFKETNVFSSVGVCKSACVWRDTGKQVFHSFTLLSPFSSSSKRTIIFEGILPQDIAMLLQQVITSVCL